MYSVRNTFHKCSLDTSCKSPLSLSVFLACYVSQRWLFSCLGQLLWIGDNIKDYDRTDSTGSSLQNGLFVISGSQELCCKDRSFSSSLFFSCSFKIVLTFNWLTFSVEQNWGLCLHILGKCVINPSWDMYIYYLGNTLAGHTLLAQELRNNRQVSLSKSYFKNS